MRAANDEEPQAAEKRFRLDDAETLRCNKSELFLVECELSRDSDELSDSAAALSRVNNTREQPSETLKMAEDVVSTSGDDMNVDDKDLTQNGFIQVSFLW